METLQSIINNYKSECFELVAKVERGGRSIEINPILLLDERVLPEIIKLFEYQETRKNSGSK